MGSENRTTIGRRPVKLVRSSTAAFSGEQDQLLRTRLRAASFVIALTLAVYLVRGLFFADEALLGLQLGLFVIIGGCTVLLSVNERLEKRTLRTLEAVVFGLTALFVALKYRVLISDAVDAGDDTAAMVHAHRLASSFFTLMIIYGLMIPGPWKRAAGVSGVFLLAPVAAILALRWQHPTVKTAVPELVGAEYMTAMILYLFIGGVTAVYGARVINRLRREAHEARQYGQYRLIEKIGEGGMGEVWKAKHRLLVRPAAVKLISANTIASSLEGRETVVRRFENEVHATTSLESPHTVKIFDFGSTPDGDFYYAMELLEGIDLETLVREEGPVPPDRVVFFLAQVCHSLAEAHDRGMIHRDVKPANIHACRLGMSHDFIKVLDFGLVKLETPAGDAGLTSVGIVGTPAYLAPEQVRDDDFDHRVDIYALGCVALWLLTGEYVFTAKNPVDMAVHHMQDEPRPPSARTDEPIPAELEDLIMECLAKNPDERPADAVILRERLLACRSDDPWTQDKARDWWEVHGDLED